MRGGGEGRERGSPAGDDMVLVKQDARWEFFRVFYTTGQGLIVGLATIGEHLRDGMALLVLSRFFSALEYPRIRVEPSHPGLVPTENLILVGLGDLFVNPQPGSISGDQRIALIGDRKLGARLRPIRVESGYCFAGDGPDRCIVNTVTGQRYCPRVDAEAGVVVDYAVITRVFRGPLENTILIEGPHRLGTFGGALAATSDISLAAIWDAVSQLGSFDESLPLEILVRATFHDDLRQGVFVPDAVAAVPLNVVYGRQWIFDLEEGRRWRDQLPWDVVRVARAEEASRSVESDDEPCGMPRVEIEADLRDASPELRKLGRECLRNGRAPVARPGLNHVRFLREVAAAADRFRVTLIDELPSGANARHVDLPHGRSDIRSLRKHFFVHLAFCRMFGFGFHCGEEDIRTYFPEFGLGRSKKTFTAKFVSDVASKMRGEGGFGPVLGEPNNGRRGRLPGSAENPDKDKGYMWIQHSRKDHTYTLKLENSSLLVKLRL